MNPGALKIALEANPDVAACLQCSLHGAPGLRVLNVAATDSDRPVRLYCAKSSGLSSAVRAVGTPIVVRGLPLDDIWPTSRPVDFIKCDVEGGELDVLRGGRRIRNRYGPIWMLEFDKTFMSEARIKPDELADEVSDMLCRWRSETGWLVAKNLAAIAGEKHLVCNVFLVPPIRADQFRTWSSNEKVLGRTGWSPCLDQACKCPAWLSSSGVSSWKAVPMRCPVMTPPGHCWPPGW
jgi:FkbM family methyltransferase